MFRAAGFQDGVHRPLEHQRTSDVGRKSIKAFTTVYSHFIKESKWPDVLFFSPKNCGAVTELSKSADIHVFSKIRNSSCLMSGVLLSSITQLKCHNIERCL